MVQLKHLIIYSVTIGRSKFAFENLNKRQKLSSILEETQVIYMRLQLCIPGIPVLFWNQKNNYPFFHSYASTLFILFLHWYHYL